MGIKHRIKRSIENMARLGESATRRTHRHNANLDALLATLADKYLAVDSVSDPLAWIDFLRDCFEPQNHRIERLRTGSCGDALLDRRFASLLDGLKTRVPPIETADALKLAMLADEPRRDRQAFASQNWAGDAGLHAAMASSNGRKGRLVSTVVRFIRPEHVLELGTAYGVGAGFITAALARLSPTASLTSIEGMAPQHEIAARLLATHFPQSKVRVCHSDVREVMSQVMTDPKPNLVFHDATHTADAYVKDFAILEPLIPSGGVFLLDDINWQDARFVGGDAKTHDGWRQVANHARVAAAAEIDGALGILLLK